MYIESKLWQIITGLNVIDGVKNMNIQIFGTKKCFDTKKAERYFKERKIKYQPDIWKTWK